MIIACVDVETSTAKNLPDPEVDEICEFGMVIADVDTRTVLTQISLLYKPSHWSEESEAIHKIPESLCNLYNDAKDDLPRLENIVNLDVIDYVIAHNAPYDYGVLKRYWKGIAAKPWLCSKEDFAHDKVRVTSKRLTHLAADYEVPIIGAHRALADCHAVMKIAFENDLEAAWKKKSERKFMLFATGEYQKDIPPQFKDRNWRWDPGSKSWYKDNVPASEMKSEVKFVKSINFKLNYEEIDMEY